MFCSLGYHGVTIMRTACDSDGSGSEPSTLIKTLEEFYLYYFHIAVLSQSAALSCATQHFVLSGCQNAQRFQRKMGNASNTTHTRYQSTVFVSCHMRDTA